MDRYRRGTSGPCGAGDLVNGLLAEFEADQDSGEGRDPEKQSRVEAEHLMSVEARRNQEALFQ